MCVYVTEYRECVTYLERAAIDSEKARLCKCISNEFWSGLKGGGVEMERKHTYHRLHAGGGHLPRKYRAPHRAHVRVSDQAA